MSIACDRARSLVLAAFAIAFSISLVQPVAGQGAEMVPDPISSRELSKYATRLDLTGAQRQAMSSVHDQYRREYATLREGDISEFLNEMYEMQLAGTMPTLEAAEKILKGWQKLLNKVKAIDESFFARLEPMLDDPQKIMLPRLRLLRERERFRAGGMFALAGRMPTDLSEIFVQLDLPDDVRAEVDPAMAAYEQKLTKQVRKIAGMAASMMRDMLAIMEEGGYADLTEEDMADPETLRRIQEDSMQAWQDISSRATKVTEKISDLNRKTFAHVVTLLPQEPARTFRNRYYRQAYPEASMMLHAAGEDWLAKAGQNERLTDDQRSEIEVIVDAHRREADGLLQKAVKLIDERRKNSSPFSPDMAAMADHREALSEIQTKAMELLARTQKAIGSIVPAESTDRDVLAAAVIDPAALAAGIDQASVTVVEIDGVGRQVVDQWIPRPISTRDLKRYAEKLNLDDSSLAIAKSIRAQYQEQVKESPEIVELLRATANLWTVNNATGQATPPRPQAIDHCYDLRMKARAAIEAIDQAFFDDLKALVGADREGDVAQLRIRRLRSGYTSSRYSRSMYGMGGSNEGSIDLLEFFDGFGLDDEVRAHIESMLVAYQAASLPALRNSFTAAMAYQQASERWSTRMQSSQNVDAAEQMAIWEDYRAKMAPLAKAMNGASEQLATLNRQTFAAIEELLPGDSRHAIERQYKRMAYPSVYNDPVAVEGHLGKAMQLDDLTPTQLQELSTLAASYGPDYEKLSEQMIGLSQQPNFMFMDREDVDMQELMKRQQDLGKIKFERDDMTYRAIYQLQTLLTTEQIEQIGGLPEPPEQRTFPW